MKKLYFFCMAMVITVFGYAQNVNVTATSGTPTATYANLKLAFDALNAGTHQGDIIIEIAANGTDPAASAVLNGSGAGSALYTSVLIRPSNDAVNISATQATGRGVIELNGADNVTIDGDNPNTAGINRNLEIKSLATATTTYTSVVRIVAYTSVITSADNNTVKNCLITGSAVGRNISGATSTTGSENTTYGILAGATGTTTPASNTAAPSAVASVSTLLASGGTINLLKIINNEIISVARGIALQGSSLSVCPILEVSNNLIGAASSGATSTVYSIGMTLQGFNSATIANNTIQNIESYISTSIRAIDIGGLSTNINGANINANTIKGVFSRSTSGYGSYGINISGISSNTSVVSNNIISGLLKDMTGTLGFGTTFNVNGIRISGGSGWSVIHNTVNLSGALIGTATGQLTSCLTITSTTITGVTVLNNLFSNKITGGLAASAHVCVYLPASATSAFNLNINNNGYFTGSIAGTSGIAHIGTTYAATAAGASTYSGLYTVANFVPASTTGNQNFRTYTNTLKAATGNDNSSFALTSAVPFVSSTDFHIMAGVTTQLESGGTPSTIARDFDNETRPNGTAPDIGADEFVGVPVDLTAPSIVFTPLPLDCSFANRTLSATITDLVSGVPTSGTSAPRIYFRKNAGAWSNTTGSLVSGTGNAGTWDMLIDVSMLGGVVANDVIEYFVIAEDLSPTPNISSNPSGVTATSVSAITVYPTGNTYTVGTTLSGSKNVGTGGDYTTLTSAANAFNNACLTGPVIFNLTDANYSAGETFPIIISSNPTNNSTNSLTIKPATGVVALVSGNSAVATLQILGADYVTIDGSNNGTSTRDLTFEATNVSTTASVVWVGSTTIDSSSNVTIKNIITKGNAPTTTFVGIFAGSGTTAGAVAARNHANLVLQNNMTTKSQYGIAVAGSPSPLQSGVIIENNIIGSDIAGDNIGFRGLFLSNNTGAQVNKNTVKNIVTSVSTNPTGIFIASNVINSTINANIVDSIRYSGSGGYGGKGIEINTGSVTSNITLSNNMVSRISGDGWSSLIGDAIVGVRIGATGSVNSTTGGIKIYNNTIKLSGSIAGNTSGTVNAAMFISSTATTIDLRNNILINSLDNTNATDKSYALNSAATSNTQFSSIDYNNYFVSGTPGTMGSINAVDRLTLADMITGFGGNANSKNNAITFVGNADLHIVPASNVTFDNLGTPIAGITTDIDNDARSMTTPDIGADEFAPPSCAGTPNMGSISPSTATLCVGAIYTITATGLSTGLGISYQWKEGPVGGPYTNISGANSTSYTTPALAVGTYEYLIETTCSTSMISNISSPIAITVNPKPTATTTPTGTVDICSPATQLFTANTNATSPLYQWKLNGANISGQTNSTYTAASSGAYQVVISEQSSGCKDSSAIVTLNVNPLPSSVTITPSVSNICAGTIQTLTGSGGIISATTQQGSGTLTTTPSSNTSSLGPNPLQSYFGGAKQQMIVLSTELFNMGLVNGSVISSLAFNMTATEARTLQNYVVKISNTSLNAFATSTFEPAGTVVRNAANFTPITGWNTITFDNNFTWNGTSNLLIEVNFSNNDAGGTGTNVAQYSATTGAMTLFYRADNLTAAAVDAATTATFSPYLQRNNFRLTYSIPTMTVWSPVTGLYTDAAATMAYTGGMETTVYAKPTATTTYQYTATSSAGCSSTTSAAVNVTPATVAGAASADQTICSGSSPANITLSGHVGSVVKWQSSADAAFTSPTDIANTTNTLTSAEMGPLTANTWYRAVVQNSTCDILNSDSVMITVNSIPSAPTGAASQSFCESASPTLASLMVTGASIKWYDMATGGMELPSSTSLTNGTHYYASQTVGGCESSSRLDVTAVLEGTVVLNSNNSGPGSLRAAVACALENGMVTVDAGVTTINLTESLMLDKNLTVMDAMGAPVNINFDFTSITTYGILIIANKTVTLENLNVNQTNNPGQLPLIQVDGTLNSKGVTTSNF